MVPTARDMFAPSQLHRNSGTILKTRQRQCRGHGSAVVLNLENYQTLSSSELPSTRLERCATTPRPFRRGRYAPDSADRHQSDCYYSVGFDGSGGCNSRRPNEWEDCPKG